MNLILVNRTKTRIGKALFEKLLVRAEQLLNIPHEQVELLLCDNATIQAFNRDYRGKDAPTDVLSFSLNSDDNLGQLIISVERAEEQAAELGQSLEEELKFLFTHGLLHLLGYDHETPEEESEMLKWAYQILERPPAQN